MDSEIRRHVRRESLRGRNEHAADDNEIGLHSLLVRLLGLWYYIGKGERGCLAGRRCVAICTGP